MTIKGKCPKQIASIQEKYAISLYAAKGLYKEEEWGKLAKLSGEKYLFLPERRR